MADAEAERFDGILLNIAQQAGSIDSILDIFFGFMNRKTDFFTGAKDADVAQDMILKYFTKHWKLGLKKRNEQQEKNRLADEERKKRAEEKKKKDAEEYEKKMAEQKKKDEEAPKIEEVTEEEAAEIKAKKSGKESTDAKEEKKADASDEKKAEGDDEEDSKEPPPLGNGGKTEKYVWTQTLSALEVYVDVKPGVRAKEIICDIGNDTLKLGVKGEPLILSGKMHAKVKPDDCMWTLLDNKCVQITLEKFDNMKWWSCVMEGDTAIDTKKIVPENSKLGDLDGETRMTVEKMMYDQRQKALGKPTSDQEKQHDLLEKFKAAHPEMDFSKAKINYGGGGGGGFNFGQ